MFNAIIPSMDAYFAIDIGGTQLRAGLYPADSTNPLVMKKISTRGKESAVDRLIGLISDLWPGDGTYRPRHWR